MSDKKDNFSHEPENEYNENTDGLFDCEPEIDVNDKNPDKKGVFSGGEFGGENFEREKISENSLFDQYYEELFGEKPKKQEMPEDTAPIPVCTYHEYGGESGKNIKSKKENKAGRSLEDTIIASDMTEIDAPEIDRSADRIEPDDRKDTGPDNFEIDFDFDKEYGNGEDEEPERIVKRREGKRTGCVGGILYFLFIICVSALLAFAAWAAATDVLALGKEDSEVEVTIPRDFTIDDVSNILYSNNMIKYKKLFVFYADFSHADQKIDAGTYILNTNYDYRALVNGMSKATGKEVEVNVTIPEGYTLRQIFTLLEENKICYADELWDAATNYDFEYDFLDSSTLGQERRLEGFLFPDTYTFYQNDEPENVIKKMLNNFENKFTEDFYSDAEALGYSVSEVITVASIIEREAGSNDERAAIASVIYNRLESDSFPYLQMDSIINYAIAGTDTEFSTDLDSPYNCYTHEGLPPTPISNPGLASIEAALNPESTDYYYFALSKSGTHEFFTYQSSFEAFLESDEYAGN